MRAKFKVQKVDYNQSCCYNGVCVERRLVRRMITLLDSLGTGAGVSGQNPYLGAPIAG